MVVEFNTLADWDEFSKRLSYSLKESGYIHESKRIERFSYSFFPSSTEYYQKPIIHEEIIDKLGKIRYF